MNTRALLITGGVIGLVAVGVFFLKGYLKQTVTVAATSAAPAAGYNAGKGAVDAVFQNVQTMLNRTATPQTGNV